MREGRIAGHGDIIPYGEEIPGREKNMEVIYFKSASEFRQWLRVNHDQAKELWVGFFKKGSGEEAITYAEAVDQALWLDRWHSEER
jgi:uncharacterized protein YdeI (YjbR/CyaY-like superfamily)